MKIDRAPCAFLHLRNHVVLIWLGCEFADRCTTVVVYKQSAGG